MNEIMDEARRVFQVEVEWLEKTLELNQNSFTEAVRLLRNTRGKVAVFGMGKSGLVGRKIAATMTSTGTPAYFIHPSEGIHGDIGLLAGGDTALVLSKSGDTPEIGALLPILVKLKIPVIAMVACVGSILAKHAQVVLRLPQLREACPYNLAPTASTTAMMALGDALSMALLRLSGFSPEDFADVHPGGILGRKLLMRVRDLMVSDSIPLIQETAPLSDAIDAMTAHRGICIAGKPDGTLAGVFVYGDLGRLMKTGNVVPEKTPLGSVMKRNPLVCGPSEPLSIAVQRMEDMGVTSLVAVNEENIPVGVLYLHDALVMGF